MQAISFSKDALKFVQGLEAKPARQLYEKMLALTSDPRPPSSTQLVGFKGYMRLRVGDFRVVYSVSSSEVKVALVDSRSDDEVYKRLERLVG